MSRTKGQTAEQGRIRAELEGVQLALVEAQDICPGIALRLEQAERRAQLSALLEPALEDVQRMHRAIEDAKRQVGDLMRLLGARPAGVGANKSVAE